MRHLTIQGLGAIAQSSYLPSLYGTFSVTGVEINPKTAQAVKSRYPNVTIAESLRDVPEKNLLIIATPPEHHVTGMKAGISSGFQQIVCEKPATSEETELKTINRLLNQRESEGKILLGDHWLGRLLTWHTLFSHVKNSELKK